MTKFNGITNNMARFVENAQLMNRENWKLFVEQFRKHTDDIDNGWRGEYFGKMMRGASVTYRYTESEELYDILTDTAEDMLTTQDSLGRFSSYSVEKEFNGWDMWGRKYVLLGFLHYCEICRDEDLKKRIISALEKHLDYIVAKIGNGENQKKIGETSDAWKCVNSASILEPVLIMYKKLGKKSYLEFAEYIIDYLQNSEACIFKCAYEDKIDPYQYPVIKAYEVMSCFEGLLEYYDITGDKKWFDTVFRFVNRLRKSDVTIIGCCGCSWENFNNSSITQTDADCIHIMQETCVTVTWMKLCLRMLVETGDSSYADEIERSAYNALYGAVNTLNRKNQKGENFVFDSYSPLLLNKRSREVGGYKNIAENKYYGCCVAIGAHGTGMIPLYAARSLKDGIVVDFYESGTVSLNGFKLEIKTVYPKNGTINIVIKEAPSQPKALKLRIPAYTCGKATAKLNGENIKAENGYLQINRKWVENDTVELIFDFTPRVIRATGTEEKPNTKKFIAVEYGPLVMARDKRFAEVGTAVNADEMFKFSLCDTESLPCEICADVSFGNKTFKMIDYMSAGKTWDEDSLTEAWISTLN